jgi:hypothetical protein
MNTSSGGQGNGYTNGGGRSPPLRNGGGDPPRRSSRSRSPGRRDRDRDDDRDGRFVSFFVLCSQRGTDKVGLFFVDVNPSTRTLEITSTFRGCIIKLILENWKLRLLKLVG